MKLTAMAVMAIADMQNPIQMVATLGCLFLPCCNFPSEEEYKGKLLDHIPTCFISGSSAIRLYSKSAKEPRVLMRAQYVKLLIKMWMVTDSETQQTVDSYKTRGKKWTKNKKILY